MIDINKRLVDSRTIFEFKEIKYGDKPKSNWHEQYQKKSNKTPTYKLKKKLIEAQHGIVITET